jgi:hypothetical protein
MADGLLELFTQRQVPSPEELGRAVVQIKKLQKHQSDAQLQGYYDRLQRAASWLAKAGKTVRDPEATFIFSWIALNALSAVRTEVFKTQWWEEEGKTRPKLVEQRNDQNNPRELEWFLWRVSGLDIDGKLLRGVSEDHWDDIQAILQTRYLLSAYWAFKRQAKDIERSLEVSEKTARAAIGLVIDRK